MAELNDRSQARNRLAPWAGVVGLIVAGVVVARASARAARALDLSGKRILITGASRGLGLILARKLRAEGAHVVLLARNRDSLERARAAVLAEGDGESDVFTMARDFTDVTGARGVIAEAQALLGGPVDILINNAGVIQVGPMETMTDADYEEAMRTHFWGPYALVQAVLPSMRARRSGRIVNIASIGGKVSVPHLLPYSTSKFALVGFSGGLRAEVMKDGVYVTTVCPGLIRTGSPRNAWFKGQHRLEYAWFALSDSLPGVSMSADRCADQIIDALRHGDAEIVTSAVGKIAAVAHGIFPGLVIDTLGQINRLLPGPGEAGTERHTGAESESPTTRSLLTALTRAAEARNNELGGE